MKVDPKAAIDRVVREATLGHLRSAIDALSAGGGPKAVHQARKSSKRARAVLDLLGGPRAEVVSDHIGDASRLISEVRDADVMRGIAAENQWDLEVPEFTDRDARASSTAEGLAMALREAEALPFERIDETYADVRLERSRRRTRRALHEAADDPEPEVFHTWRKRLKRWLYQCELLAGRRPELAPLLERLDELQEVLGNHHDLCVLRELHPDHSEALDLRIRMHEVRALSEGHRLLG